MPIERFLAQRDSKDHSDSFAVAALDLPLPPPTAADFPELPRAAPTPKMSKAEKAMAQKINALLLSDVKGKRAPETPGKRAPDAHAPSSGKPPARSALTGPPASAVAESAVPESAPTPVETSVTAPTLGMIPIPACIRTEVLGSSPQLSGMATPPPSLLCLLPPPPPLTFDTSAPPCLQRSIPS